MRSLTYWELKNGGVIKLALDLVLKTSGTFGYGDRYLTSPQKVTLLVPYGVIKVNQLTEPMMVPIPKKIGEILNTNLSGELSEWFMEHAWKACASERVPGVRIPHSPHIPGSHSG